MTAGPVYNVVDKRGFSFVPSAVRVNNEAVYSAPREVDRVMTSIGEVRIPNLSDFPTSRALLPSCG